ncbi:PHD-zinc-finger like domain protein [Cryptosporidium meleagridis]|uniref:PHD-zinc-finger like domain protein n=1 Tax=Cryptosporidium meleagridis TaxID=93969 RepID=A0A2P4Z525_9CRYT|nr:PHD-zinc-finger like domain protein [Cryptosporidium meleagridis]
MKTKDQKPSRNGKSGIQALNLEKEAAGLEIIHKENDSEERRVTRSMRKSGEKVVFVNSDVNQDAGNKHVTIGTGVKQSHIQTDGSFTHTQEHETTAAVSVAANNDSKNILNHSAQDTSNSSMKRKNKKVLRKSKRGRHKNKSKHKTESNSLGKVANKDGSQLRNFDNRTGKETYSVSELDMDITSVTLINENSTNTPTSAGGSSRMAKIGWSRFDSFFRKIPMGAKKDIILKTIPSNPVQRKPIIQELTTLEQTLFTDPPWGKIGRASPYVNKASLSLPPIYMKTCSLDAIVDLVSKSILKSRGGHPSKMLLEIQKPYFLLFELPRSLSLVALEPKSPLELGISEVDPIQPASATNDHHIFPVNVFPEIKSATTNLHIQQQGQEPHTFSHISTTDFQNQKLQVPDILDNFNVKWDILQTLDLSYYQFKYIERYLHDVFFNYDQSHKKVFFTPAKINNKQDLYTINIFEKIKGNLNELNSIVNLNVSSQIKSQNTVRDEIDNNMFLVEQTTIHDPIDLENLINEFNIANNPCETNLSETTNTNINTNNINNSSTPVIGTIIGSSPSIQNQNTLETPLYREDLWGTYRSYDPIYWWVDFVLPSTNPYISTYSDQKVYLHKNGLSYIDAPSCVELGGLYWLDPYKPIKLTREAKDKDRFNINAQSLEEDQKNMQDTDSINQEDLKQESDTLFIHPYMMNDFVDHKDFNFVEANLERFLPIYNEIIDSIANLRLKIQNRIIYENENNVRITDIPFIWMNVVQRYQIVNSWNKLKFFLVNGYKDLYPAFLRQADASKKMESDQDNNRELETKHKDEKKTKLSKFDALLESKEKNMHLTNVCSVCFNWETDTLKPFVECVRCGVVSHVACYGVNIPLNELLDFYGWLCDRCEFEKKFLGTQYLIAFNPGSISCVLCSHSGGAMKRTNKDGIWVHLVCAIWHLPLVTCEDWKNLSNWNVDRVKRSWTNKRIGRENNSSHVLSQGKSGTSGSSIDILNTGIGAGTGTGASGVLDFGQRSTSSVFSNHTDSGTMLKLESINSDSATIEDDGRNLALIQNPSLPPKESLENSFAGPQPILDLDDEALNNSSPRCVFCRNDNTFGLVGCDHENCIQLFHPICAWLNGVQIEVDCDPCYSRGETLVGYIQGWRNVQDEALQLVNIRCFCMSHIRNKGNITRNFDEEVNLRKKRYINRDMFPDLFNSKFNQKSSRSSQIGVIQRSRTRSVSRSKSWDVTNPNMTKKNSCEIFKQNQVYYYNALNPDKYDRDICSVCLKYDSTDFPSKRKASLDNNNGIVRISSSGEECHDSNFSIILPEKSISDNEGEEEEILASNLLMSCKCCGLTVHWSCYGLGEKMESINNFVCQACIKGVRPENTSCILCPRRGGALIEAQGIPQNLTGRPGERTQFVHIICSLYTPGIYRLECGQVYGAANYLGMTSLVKLQKDGTISKNKGTFVRRFGCIEGSVQQFPFRDIRNEEQFILEQFSDQDTLEIPSVYCCICKSSYGVNLACNHPGCTRTAHPLCMKLYGCYMETIAEIEEPIQMNDMLSDSLISGSQGLYRSQSNGGTSNVLFVSPNCQPPNLDNSTIRGSEIRENYFTQKVFCPEHGKQMGKLNPGGKLLHSTLSSLKIVSKILGDLGHSERLKRQLFTTQLDIMNKENPIFSPLMIRNINALRIYWDYYSRGILQESVKIRNGTINKFKDNPKNGILIKPLTSQGESFISGNYKSPKKVQQSNSVLQCNQTTPCSASGAPLKAVSLKRTRSSGEATEVPSLEDAIKEARKQREIYKKELVASGIVVKKRPPPNRSPAIPFSRLTDGELKESALNCLRAIGSSSRLAMSLMTTGYNNNSESNNGQMNIPENGSQFQSNGDPSQASTLTTGIPTIRSFCIKQHRHDCFRRRLAEFIIYPPPVMDHRRKALRSLTRQLKQYGVTAEELMASDTPLPLIKSKPASQHHFNQGVMEPVLSHSNINSSVENFGVPVNTNTTVTTTTTTNTTNTTTTITNMNRNNMSSITFNSKIDHNNSELTAQTMVTTPSSTISYNNNNKNMNDVFILTNTNTTEQIHDQEKLSQTVNPQSEHNLYF